MGGRGESDEVYLGAQLPPLRSLLFVSSLPPSVLAIDHAVSTLLRSVVYVLKLVFFTVATPHEPTSYLYPLDKTMSGSPSSPETACVLYTASEFCFTRYLFRCLP